MKRLPNVFILAIVAGVFLVLPTSLGAQEFGAIAFGCPPCGCAGDTLAVADPGPCPVCGMDMVEKSGIRNVAFLIYDNMQLADLAGVYSVFEAAGSFEVYTVALTGEPIRTSGSEMSIRPDFSFESSPPPDILVIPGGGVGQVLRNSETISWARKNSEGAKLVLSVCTGAFILAKTGLIDGLSSTVLPDDISQLRQAFPKVQVVEGKRFVDNGKFLSSAGPYSGIDAALHILTRVFGNNKRASAVAAFLDYRWEKQ